MNDQELILDETSLTLLRLLVRMGRVAEGRLDALLEPHELSGSRLLALQRLEAASEPLSLSRLASCLAFVKSNATQLIDRLEQDRLVKRVPDPSDRRCTLLEVTDEGRQRQQEALEAVQPLLDRLADLYTPEERAQLLGLLRRLESGLA
jgi:DNA-binding MarR family transcriptional regulator